MEYFLTQNELMKDEKPFFNEENLKNSGILFISSKQEKFPIDKNSAYEKLEKLIWDFKGKFAFEAYKV